MLRSDLFIDAQLRPLASRGIYHYILQRGNAASGVILLKLNGFENGVRLLMQQRDLEGDMGWVHVLGEDSLEEQDVDAYIQRAMARDPDLWVIEVEDRDLNNPFEGKVF